MGIMVQLNLDLYPTKKNKDIYANINPISSSTQNNGLYMYIKEEVKILVLHKKKKLVFTWKL